MSNRLPIENRRKALLGWPSVVAIITSNPMPAGTTASQMFRQRKIAQAAM